MTDEGWKTSDVRGAEGREEQEVGRSRASLAPLRKWRGGGAKAGSKDQRPGPSRVNNR